MNVKNTADVHRDVITRKVTINVNVTTIMFSLLLMRKSVKKKVNQTCILKICKIAHHMNCCGDLCAHI